MNTRRLAALLLLNLSLTGCGTPDESIPPALAELHQALTATRGAGA